MWFQLFQDSFKLYFVPFLQGEGVERLLIKGKKPDQVEEIDGDPFRYFLLAGWIVFSKFVVNSVG